jgi:streptogramin lyase
MFSARKFTVTVTSIIALAASGLVGAPAALGDTGAVKEIDLVSGSTPRGIAVGSDNNIWVTGGSSNTIARVTPEGVPTAFALTGTVANGNPWGIAAGPDGNLWFTAPDIGLIGRMTTQGVITPFPLPDRSLRPRQIAAGSDRNMWFTEASGKIGRISMTGQIDMFDVPWPNSEPRDITPGPVGSNRLYFTDPGADRVAEVYTSGQIEYVAQLATNSDPAGIAVVGGGIWFAMSATSKIGQLVAINTILELSVPGVPTQIAPGAGNTMWISLSGQNAVAKYSSSGAPIATYPLTSPNSLPGPLVEGPGTNIWVTQRNVAKVARILSGQLPVATAAPTLSPSTGAIPGSALTTSDGTWDYAATSFTYKWQVCANATDAATCTDVPGATSKTYTVVASDVAKFIRSGVQGVNGSGPGTISFSSPLAVGSTPPPAPTPTTGGQTVTIAPGVTVTLRAANRTRAGVRRPFAVIANTANIKGKVRITIEDAAGRERQVIANGRWLKPIGATTKRAVKRKQISRSLAPGTYTVKAVFTPTPAFRDDYPVATLTKPITIRR